MRKLTTEEFIFRSTLKHGSTYDYAQSIYTLSTVKIKIICKKHGVFLQAPAQHIKGHGCPKCKIDSIVEKLSMTYENFVEKANKRHNSRYSYHQVLLRNQQEKVAVLCEAHGEWMVKPYKHLQGHGCPNCARTGIKSNLETYLYFLSSDCGEYIKVGITNNQIKRIKELRYYTPFPFSVIKVINSDYETCRRYEVYFLSNFKRAGLIGFSGASEWLRYSKNLMTALISIN